jgi:RNA polymerase sigma factor (TIGR02999 family)
VSPSPADWSRALRDATLGGKRSAEELLPLLYDDLRALARARMAREAPGQTLQATALVHEAYMRLVGDADPGWNGRAHFFGAAARAMRRILVEQARRKGRVRHGGGQARVGLDATALPVDPPGEELLAVDEALSRLEREDPRKGRIVELRYFVGLTTEETARVLDLSVGTIEREWRFIKSWLQVELARRGGD